jgi:hypothetical protein
LGGNRLFCASGRPTDRGGVFQVLTKADNIQKGGKGEARGAEISGARGLPFNRRAEQVVQRRGIGASFARRGCMQKDCYIVTYLSSLKHERAHTQLWK